VKRRTLKEDVFTTIGEHHVAGTEVFLCVEHYLGVAKGFARSPANEAICVTLNKDGDYPCFCIPEGQIVVEDVP